MPPIAGSGARDGSNPPPPVYRREKVVIAGLLALSRKFSRFFIISEQAKGSWRLWRRLDEPRTGSRLYGERNFNPARRLG